MALAGAPGAPGTTHRYSRKPVYEARAPSGFLHKVYVMYHGTDKKNVDSILKNGFRPSAKGMLGPGIYTSRDPGKTRAYGDVTLKLLVYLGRIKQVAGPDATWQQTHDSAWLPPKANMAAVPSGKEENCIKGSKQICILGVERGIENLHAAVAAKTTKVKAGAHLTDREWARLKKFVNSREVNIARYKDKPKKKEEADGAGRGRGGHHQRGSSDGRGGHHQRGGGGGDTWGRGSDQRASGRGLTAWLASGYNSSFQGGDEEDEDDDGYNANMNNSQYDADSDDEIVVSPRGATARNYDSDTDSDGRGERSNPPRRGRGRGGHRSHREGGGRGGGGPRPHRVYKLQTNSGFDHRVFISFMGLQPDEVKAAVGLSLPVENGALGRGIYVHRTLDDAAARGPVVVKLLIAPGHVKVVKSVNDPLKDKWQKDDGEGFTAALVFGKYKFPGVTCDIACLKSMSQVRLLGAVRGSSKLAANDSMLMRDLSGADETKLDFNENLLLQRMVRERVMKYMYLEKINNNSDDDEEQQQQVLELVPGGRNGFLLVMTDKEAAPTGGKFGSPNQLWTFSWGGCLENQATGGVLEVSADGCLSVGQRKTAGGSSGFGGSDSEADDDAARFQKWELDMGSRLVNPATGLAVDLPQEGDLALRATRNSKVKFRFEEF